MKPGSLIRDRNGGFAVVLEKFYSPIKMCEVYRVLYDDGSIGLVGMSWVEQNEVKQNEPR